METAPDRFFWRQRYDPGVPHRLEYPARSVTEMLTESVERHAERKALSFMGAALNYARLGDEARRFASALIALGVKPGDRVFVLLANTPHFPVVYYATLLVGGILAPASPLDTPPEIEYKLRHCGARVVVFLDLLYEKVKALRAGPDLTAFIAADLCDYLPFPKNLLFAVKKRFLGRELPHYDPGSPPLLRYREQLKFAPLERDRDAQVDPASPAVILYTGGTTGVSKGVTLSHRALVANVAQAASWTDFNESDVALGSLPFFHGFGLSMGLNMTLLNGAHMILMPRFDPDATLQHMARDGATVFAGVPTMYIALMQHPRFEKLRGSKLRGCFVGAAPVPETLKRQFYEKTGGTLIEGYGLTESVTANCAAPFRGPKKEKSIGLPWPDMEFRIVDADTGERELGPNQPGELLVRGPTLMSGYWNNPEATAAVIRDGWLYTGDIATYDEDGYFYIVDRKKDLIICGGFNVYPAEIEETLYMHKHVREACVIGAPDAYLGEAPLAFVTLHAGQTPDESELRRFLEDRLIRYKVPRRFLFRDELPKSPVGKILRKELRKQLQDGDL